MRSNTVKKAGRFPDTTKYGIKYRQVKEMVISSIAKHREVTLTPYLFELSITLTIVESPVNELFSELLNVADSARLSGMIPDTKGMINPNMAEAKQMAQGDNKYDGATVTYSAIVFAVTMLHK